MLSRKVSFPLTCFTFTRRGSRFQHHYFNRWYQGCSGCCEIASPAPPQIQAPRVGWLPAQSFCHKPTEFLTGLGSLSHGSEKLCSFFFSTLMEHKLWQQKRWANCNYTTIRNAFCILQQFWGKWRVCFETSLQRWKKKRGRGQESWSVPSGSPVQRLTAGTGRWICLFTQLPVTCDWGETWKTLIL